MSRRGERSHRTHGWGGPVDAAHGLVLGPARRRGLASRLSTGHVVMVLAGLLGALLTMNVLRTADRTRPVLVAARELAPGTVIDAGSVRVARVHADGAILATLLDARSPSAVTGRVTVAHVAAGSLLTKDAIRAAGAGAAPRAMSFPIPLSRAVGGALDVGDRVDVLAVQHNSGRGGYVATDVPVLAFTTHSGGPLHAADDASITIAVDPAAAQRVAAALETGSITLVRATGAARLPATASFEPSAPVASVVKP